MTDSTALFAAAFAALFAAHHLADYPAQTDHQAAHKADRTLTGWIANQVHAASHTVLTLLALVTLAAVLHTPLTVSGVAAGLAWVHLSHSAIDRRRAVAWWMDHTGQTGFRAASGAAHVDQAAHIALGLLPAALLIASL
ncbi:DUF3307 domain-containing protein [Kitasatospora sp. NBC_00070]|uniref:DUF3307 domain-containing protein n=1 Tax=Kitasatospora sp. NBC_00070 TaxID=2975962 RepID=UPI003253CC5B